MIDLSGFSALCQRITSATVSLDQPSNFFGHAVLLGPVSYELSTIPLPASAPLCGAAIAVLGAVDYGNQRRRLRSA